jgi:hypothetical protein
MLHTLPEISEILGVPLAKLKSANAKPAKVFCDGSALYSVRQFRMTAGNRVKTIIPRVVREKLVKCVKDCSRRAK